MPGLSSAHGPSAVSSDHRPPPDSAQSDAAANHTAPQQQVKAGGYFLAIRHFFKGEGANCSLLHLTLARRYACGHHRLITEPFPLKPEPHQTEQRPRNVLALSRQSQPQHSPKGAPTHRSLLLPHGAAPCAPEPTALPCSRSLCARKGLPVPEGGEIQLLPPPCSSHHMPQPASAR